MLGIQIVSIIAATMCVERGLMYLSIHHMKKKHIKLQKEVEGKKGPSLETLKEYETSTSDQQDMSEWIKQTQTLVTAITDVVTVSGKDVAKWSMSDIFYISNKMQGK